MNHDEAQKGFRPDLEGLRAVAVVLVVLYHARVPGFGGGFVGVDVFFVLSGFLITGLLARELGQGGTISLAGFYARRARRLLPAAAVVLVATVAASVLLLPPLRVPEIAGDAAAASLYVSNVRFALQATDYLQSELAPSPLLHFWSLGVEEQFYLFWPALLLLVGRGGGGFRRRLAITAALVSIASFAASAWLTRTNAPWAFFSLPTRAWELGLGALLAIAGDRLRAIPGAVAAALGWLGLAMVAAAGALIGTETPFPGEAALLPTIGTALVIATGAARAPWSPVGLLGAAIPRFLGRVSYSIYLWHWPLLVIPPAAGWSTPFSMRLALAAGSVVLAAMTQRWIEEPLRHGRWIGTRPGRNLALAAASSLVVAGASLGVAALVTGQLRGVQADLTADEAALDRALDRAAAAGAGPLATEDGPVPRGIRPALDAVRDSMATPYADGCHVKLGGKKVSPCRYGDVTSPIKVILFGDSHALSWFPALERLCLERGWQLLSLTMSGCGSADVVVWYGAKKRIYTECSEWRARTFDRIARERPALVVVSDNRGATIAKPDGEHFSSMKHPAEWTAGMIRTLRRLAAIPGAGVVVIGDTPRAGVDVPVCLSAHPDSHLACATDVATAVHEQWRAIVAGAAREAGVAFVDPTGWVCPTRPCPAVIETFMVHRDEHHLGPPFVAALAPRLGRALERLGVAPRRRR